MISKKSTSFYGVVGSGLFVALWDKSLQYSGCCNCIYPKATTHNQANTKYTNSAVPHLLNQMISKGSKINDLQAHLVGGADHNSHNCGDMNIKIAKSFLHYKKIEILSSDTGGRIGRKFVYESETGQSAVMRFHKIRQSDWFPYKEEK